MATPRIEFADIRAYSDEVHSSRIDRTFGVGLNHEWYRGVGGRHYDHYSKGPKGHPVRYKRVRNRQDEIRYVSHFGKTTVDRVVAAVGLTPVHFTAIPENSELKNRMAAQAGNTYLQHLRYADSPVSLMATRKRCAFLTLLDGTSFIKVGWNPNAGTEVAEGIFTGSSWMEVVPKEQLLFLDCVNDLRDAPLVIQESWWTLTELLRAFPTSRRLREAVKARMPETSYFKGQASAGAENINPSYQMICREVWSPPGAVWRTRSKNGTANILVMPNGMRQFWLEDILLTQGDNPYFANSEEPFKEALKKNAPVPYYPVAHSQDPQTFDLNGPPYMSMLRGQVPYLERLMSSMLEREIHHNVPRVLVPSGSVDMDDFANAAAGEPIEYNPHAGIPIYLNPTGVQSLSINLAQELTSMAMEDAAVMDAQRGMPKRIESGTAIQTLLQQNLARLNNYHDSIDSGLEKAQWARMLLEMAFSAGPRHLSIFSRNELRDVVEWWGTAMIGTGGVHRSSSASMAFSPAVYEQRVKENLAMGLIDAETAKDELGLPPVEGQGMSMRQEEMAIAREENRRFLVGEDSETYGFYDQAAHLSTHRLWFFQNMWELPDEIKQIALTHIDTHMQFIIDSMVTQMQMQTQGQ